ncbi:MAG: Txe/YoeB family addiction module toxin [Dorea sp.]|jgi:toxin YoeB|nr:Txe/YoeB family addiction module toxin [Dorea sp.]
MGILWEDDAWKEYLDWQGEDLKTLKRINKIIKDIQRNPSDGLGHPETLSGNLSGWWSRRIDEKNRIVYKPNEDTITILSCKGHYSDK